MARIIVNEAGITRATVDGTSLQIDLGDGAAVCSSAEYFVKTCRMHKQLIDALAELVAEADARPLRQGELGYPDTGGLALARQALATA